MSNPEYNELCYIARYPDIKNGYIFAGTDGVWYYQSNLVKGWAFQHKKLSDNAFWHWQNFGMSEGRVCGCDLPGTQYSTDFNSGAYLARYADVRISPDWKNNPQGHYEKFGIYEGRVPGFEIITSLTSPGMASPGTTTQVLDNPAINVVPGDSSIVTTDPLAIDTTANTTVSAPASVSTWIAANPTLVAAIIAGVVIIASKKHKKYSYK